MKKFLGILAVAAVFASCDNAGSNEQRVKDSTDSVKRADSMAAIMPTTPAPTMGGTDSTGMTAPAMGDSAGKMMTDSTKMPK